MRTSIHRLLCFALVLASIVGQAPTAPSLTVERELFLRGGMSHSLRYSPDGTLLASGGDHGEVIVYDAENGAVRQVLEASDHWIGALRFSPDGRRLAVLGRTLTLWDVQRGRRLSESDARHVRALDWSRDGALLAAVLHAGPALLSPRDLTRVRRLRPTDDSNTTAIAFDPTGSLVALGQASGAVCVCEVRTGKQREIHEHDGAVQDLAWPTAGRRLRLGWDGSLTGFGDRSFALEATGFDLATQPDGARAFVRTNAAVVLIDGSATKRSWPGSGPMAAHPDGRRWARAHRGRLEIYRDDELLHSWPGHHRQTADAAVLTGDGRYAVLRGQRRHGRDTGADGPDGSLQAFDLTTGERREIVAPPDLGVLVPNRTGPEMVDLRAADDDSAYADLIALRFWAIVPGQPMRLRPVRTVPVRLQQRGVLQDKPTLLSPDQRYLSHGDQLLDLLEPERSWRLDESLMSETLPAGDGEFAVCLQFHSDAFFGFGEVNAFARNGDRVGRRDYRRVTPTDLSVAPDGRRVAVCIGKQVELLAVPALEHERTLPWSWSGGNWLDEHVLLGMTSDGDLQLGDLRSETIVAELDRPQWIAPADYDLVRGRVLAVTTDRVLVVRMRLPK